MIGRSCRQRPRPWPNWRPKAARSSGKPKSGAAGQTPQTVSVPTPGLISSIARSSQSRQTPVGVVLGWRRAADVEGPVVAGAIAVERLQDVEERLIARPDQPVGEVVRMRVAALARDRVDRLDVVRAHLVEHRVRLGDDLVLPDARLQLLPDHVVDAIDHGGGLVEQRDLVDVLDLAGIEHDLLAVDHLHAGLLEREQHRGLGHVDADRRVGAAGLAQQRHDLLGMRLHQPEMRRDRAAHAEHARLAIGRVQPVAIEPVVHRRRPEIPDDRRAALGQERKPTELVALPLADLGARDVADVVDVEQQQRPALGVGKRLLRPRQPIALQPAKIDPGLEVDPHPAGRRQLALPVPVRLEILSPGRLER